MPQINSIQGLSGIKAISKYEVNPTGGIKSTLFTSNILYIVQCLSSNCCDGHLGFHRMPKINSVGDLSGIKAISKCEANHTSSFQDIAFTSNCGRTAQQTDRQGHSIIHTKFMMHTVNEDI